MLNINGLEWKIVIDVNGVLEETRFGSTYYDSLTIVINKNICNKSKKTTLLHELIHAYVYSYGFSYKESYNREEICDFIAFNIENINWLYQRALEELELCTK